MQEETCPWPLSPPVPGLTDEPSDRAVLAAQPADVGMLQPDPVPTSVGNGVFRADSSADACKPVHGYNFELLHSYPETSHLPS